jgi:hypothetical protein
VQARVIAFREIAIEGAQYAHDTVIAAGRIRRRHKGPSKALRDLYGHTPLSVAESIPWGGGQLIVGTGAEGGLPIAPEVHAVFHVNCCARDAPPAVRSAARSLVMLGTIAQRRDADRRREDDDPQRGRLL